jgi:limonene 1,2-monooxygenase
MRPERMSFGIFMAPFHRVGENPTLAMRRDMELIEWMDQLGYDEAWIGGQPAVPPPADGGEPIRPA